MFHFDKAQERELMSLIRQYQEYYKIPGVSVAVVNGGKVVFHKTIGVQNNLTQKPVDGSTVFEAASITKPVFSFAVMRLVERGKLDLDKPLYEYLSFPNIAEDPRSKSITARHVLTHRSGLPNWAFGGPGGWQDGEKLKLLFEPGEQFKYSGEGFNYLGRVIEKITGLPLEQFLKNEVNIPLGLKQTWYSDNESLQKVAAIGHRYHYPVFAEIQSPVSPASSMHTEARDFSNFMIGLIEGKGLAQESYDQLFGQQFVIPAEQRVRQGPSEQGLGLGFFLRQTEHGLLVEHGGNNGDFYCKWRFLLQVCSGAKTRFGLCRLYEQQPWPQPCPRGRNFSRRRLICHRTKLKRWFCHICV